MEGRFCFSLITSLDFRIKRHNYDISEERLYFSLSGNIIHTTIIYDPRKICQENLFFHFYFLNTDISLTVYCAS